REARRGPRARRAAIPTGCAARLEDEAGPGRRRVAADDALVHHDETAVEQLPHLDGDARVGAGPAHLHPAWAKRHGVVARDHAAVATAEAEGEGARRPSPHRVRRGRRFAEAAIEV